jgi:hypothetical protein
MTVMPYPAPEEYDDDMPLPERPRRRWWGPGTAVVLAVLLGAIGFYVGVRVEKSQLGNSTASTGTSAAAAGFAARAAAARAGGAGAAGAAGPSAAGGFAARFGAGGNGTFGTVSSVAGRSLYVTDASGNTVKVTFTGATKVTKSIGVSKAAIRPGDTVVVQGIKGSNGNVTAASVSDSGARAGGSGAGAGGGGSTGNNASSAVNSLFGGG